MLLIYLPEISKRSEYIFEYLFTNQLGIAYTTTTDLNIFTAHSEEKINYSKYRFSNEFFIKANGLLCGNSIEKITPRVTEKHGMKVLFPSEECDLTFDIFSAIFYLISRYEEYLPFNPDKYGRFDALESVAFQNQFLEIPIVDIWILFFKNVLQNWFTTLKMKPPVFKAILTYDIDVAYKYSGRSILRTMGAMAKDALHLDFTNILNRIKTLSGLKKDPYDVYGYLAETIKRSNLNRIFFFLMGDKSENDRNLDYKNPGMRNLIKMISQSNEIGLHPSFVSNTFPEKLLVEKNRLETISGKKITKSRQHFLKVSLPHTYQNLISAGIQEDYSMGYGEVAGFRAGTCKPFIFYDLKNEQSTNLKVFPVSWMEVTYGDFLKKTPEESLVCLFNVLEQVKKVNGTFISIWHNNTIIKTKAKKDWFWVHEEMVKHLEKLILP